MPEDYGEVGDLVTCPSCGKIWPKGTKFCTFCGTWIETGQVLDPTSRPSVQPQKPSQPGTGAGSPGIGPGGPEQGAAFPPSPRFRPGTVPSPPPSGFSAQTGLGASPVPPAGPPPSGMPGQPPPTAPVAGAEGAPVAEPAKKKYSLAVQPPREERIPQGPMFIPKREERRKKKVGVKQVIIIIICLLAIAYAVISMAFKPLHGFIMGKAFELIGKPEQAMKYYQKAADSDTMWAEPATKAMTRIGKGVLSRHLEMQFYGNWKVKTKITIQGRTGPIQLESDIAYKAPGFVSEAFRRPGTDMPAYRRLLNDQMYGVSFGGNFREQLSAADYSNRVDQQVKLSASALFDKANADKVINVLFDDIGMKLDQVLGEGENKRYLFSVEVADNEERLLKLDAVMTPFFPWGQWRLRSGQRDIARVQFRLQEKDGFLEEIIYYDANGTVVVDQLFEGIEAGATIDDNLFRP